MYSKYLKYIPFILVMVLFISACSGSEEQVDKEMTPSDYVEQARFVSLEGDTVSISEFKGKVVMIDFWETWCKPCLSSFPTLQNLMEEYPDDFVVLAVTPGFTDTREDARKFAEQHDYDFVFLMDDMGLNNRLGVPAKGIPYKVFVGPDGKYITESLGSYGPESDYKKVNSIIQKSLEGNGS